jgi:aspartyl-tRNA(Asn)/glutamyl-tRNA(Gln) amidotransferase subunit B
MHYLDVSDADMEKGQMRVEVNISLSDKEGELGTKVEIKNINSFRSVEKAIDYEIERQGELLEKKEKIVQETRGWNDARGTTVSQREKEEAHDYRYFPEPDLPPLKISSELTNKIKSEIPELPQQKRARLRKEYGLEKEFAEIFVYNKPLSEYFEKVVSELEPNLPKEELFCSVKLATNYLTTDLKGLLGESPALDKNFIITPKHFAEFIALIYKGEISSKIAKVVLAEMFKAGGSPSSIVKEKGLVQITDESEIEKVVKEVISDNPQVIEDFKSGKANVSQFLVGQVMARTKGKANPQIVNSLLNRLLTK